MLLNNDPHPTKVDEYPFWENSRSINEGVSLTWIMWTLFDKFTDLRPQHAVATKNAQQVERKKIGNQIEDSQKPSRSYTIAGPNASPRPIWWGRSLMKNSVLSTLGFIWNKEEIEDEKEIL